MSPVAGLGFSTFDQDHDTFATLNCAVAWPSGWWMSNCGAANLNGLYNGTVTTVGYWTGIYWYGFRGTNSLRKTEMKIRPTV